MLLQSICLFQLLKGHLFPSFMIQKDMLSLGDLALAVSESMAFLATGHFDLHAEKALPALIKVCKPRWSSPCPERSLLHLKGAGMGLEEGYVNGEPKRLGWWWWGGVVQELETS